MFLIYEYYIQEENFTYVRSIFENTEAFFEIFFSNKVQYSFLLSALIFVLFSFLLLLLYFFYLNKMKVSKYEDELENLNFKLNSIFENTSKELKNKNKEKRIFKVLKNREVKNTKKQFFSIANIILEVSKRNQDKLSLLLLDIDNLALVNTKYGEKMGDKLILNLAKKLEKHTRNSDILSRMQGGSFIVLLPYTGIEGAETIANELKNIIEAYTLKVNENANITYTISIGISAVKIFEDSEITSAITRVEKALFLAKKSGKNSIYINKD